MKSFREEEEKPPRCSFYYNKRKFDFYETEWTIEKFSLASCRADWSFQTPEFMVRGGRHATQWTLSLESGPSERSPIRLNLKRSSSDNGPDSVWVDWRTRVSDASGRDHGKTAADTLCCFMNGTLHSCEGLTTSVASIVEAFEPFQEPDSLTVRCELIFFPERGPSELEEFEPCRSKHVERLSENLLDMFLTRNDHDLELRFGDDKTIRAHKIVVLSRIRKLNYWLEQQRRGRKAKGDDAASGGREVLDLSHLHYTAMQKVLEYAYSGDLKYVLVEPSLSVSDCAWALDVPELKSHYTPDRLAFRTDVESHEFRLRWLIPNVVGRLASVVATCPEIVDDLYGCRWRLYLFHENDADTDYLGICAECVDDTHEFLDLCLDIALLDKSDQRVLARRLRRSNDDPGMLGIERFVSANAAALSESLAVDGCLRIVVRLRISEGLNASFIDSLDTFHDVAERRGGGYASLSADMASAFESGFFSDLHLENNGVLYKIHKCVVAARCDEMYNGIRRMEDSDADTFRDVESNVFRVLLKYIYTGVFDEGDDNTHFLLALYKTAAHFNLPLLKDCCFERLQRMVERDHAARETVLEFAEQNNDEAMKEMVLKSIADV